MRISEEIILLAEEDEDHVILIRKGFQRVGVLNPLYVVRDGEEVLAYLKGEGPFANRAEYPLPTLLLLDLKMPRMDGFQVLEWIRQDPHLRRVPVVVLTSSEDIRDVNRAYDLGANSFLVKPMNMEDLVRLTTAIHGYWLWVSEAPEVKRAPKQKPDPAER
jgi:CheY-like chemotaxis protein